MLAEVGAGGTRELVDGMSLQELTDNLMADIKAYGDVLDRLGQAYIEAYRCPKCHRHASPSECGSTITPTKGGNGFKCSGYRCAVWKGER